MRERLQLTEEQRALFHAVLDLWVISDSGVWGAELARHLGWALERVKRVAGELVALGLLGLVEKTQERKAIVWQ